MKFNKFFIILDAIFIAISLVDLITYKNLFSLMLVAFFTWTFVNNIKEYSGVTLLGNKI